MMSKGMLILAAVLTLAAVGQIGLTFVLYSPQGVDWLRNAGWIVMTISAIFGWLPIFTFRQKGGVAPGENYVRTTRLVDSGIYGTVRHPQYLAGVLMSLALALIAQHWLVALLGVIASAAYYAIAVYEEQACIDKFGVSYVRYMDRVPRMNAVLGIFRHLSRRLPG